ncbi:MAG: sortase [Clostridiales bacterium]|nr:sortase [Clostridiales bacterium]
MNNYKPVKIKRKNRADSMVIRSIIFRVLPIVLVVIISVCGFTIFNKRISEILAHVKHNALADRGTIDDPMLDNYSPLDIDWKSLFSSTDENGFDPLALSPLELTDGSRPSNILGTTEFEQALGYTNKQSTLWSINNSINKDITAWIYMYGMGINYPIAQENGKIDYYLRRSYDGTQSTSGTIFMPSACSINPLSRNLILHGHNMRDGTMFATLTNFLRGTKAYYDSHKYIFLDTLYGTYRYEIYSVYQTDPEDIYLQVEFSSNSSFLNWCNETYSKSLFKDTETTFTANDRILTLSTCDATNKYRIIVHAKMVYPEPVGDIDSAFTDSETGTPLPPDTINPEEITPTPTLQPSATQTPNIPTPPVTENVFSAGKVFKINLTDPKSTLRLRNQPNTSSVIEAALAHGTKVTIISEHNEWVKVKTEGSMEGYLQKRFLIPIDEFVQTTPSSSIGAPTTNLITPTPAIPTA